MFRPVPLTDLACSMAEKLVLLLQLPADPAAPYTAWLDGGLLPAQKPAAVMLALCATKASAILRAPTGTCWAVQVVHPIRAEPCQSLGY